MRATQAVNPFNGASDYEQMLLRPSRSDYGGEILERAGSIPEILQVPHRKSVSLLGVN
jgi:hypothetical protein